MELVRGTIKGTSNDIEAWIRVYFESFRVRASPGQVREYPLVEIERESAIGDNPFKLSLRGDYVLQLSTLQRRFTCATIGIVGWSNGTADVKIFGFDSLTDPQWGSGNKREQFFGLDASTGEPTIYRKIIEQFASEFVKQFPTATNGTGDEQRNDPRSKRADATTWRGTGQPPKTRAEKIAAVQAWDSLDPDKKPPLPNWIESNFGIQENGDLAVAESTFHGWRKYLSANS